jgi:hypothetical protein
MVLANDTEVIVVQDGETHLLHTNVDAKDKAALHEIHSYSVPVPIAVVRSHLSVYEDDCVRRLLTRTAGADLVDGWTKGPESNGISVVHGRVEGTSWRSLRTTGKLYVSAEKAARVLMAADMVPKYDDMTKSVQVIEKLSDVTEVRLASCNAVLITSPRDLCVTTTVRHEPSGRIVIATRSVDHPAGDRDGYVRALSYISGYVLTPDPHDPNVCEMALNAHMALGGNMPAFVVRYLGLSAPIKLVEKIREVVLAAPDL